MVLAFVARPPQIARAHLLIDIASNLSPEALAVLRAVSRSLPTPIAPRTGTLQDPGQKKHWLKQCQPWKASSIH